MPDNDDWEEVWEARVAALSEALGGHMVDAFHAPNPFALGGQADVVAFDLLGGRAYVTAELTGKPDGVYADYELMICHRSPTTWGANLISQLAPYTQEARILAGETMDIDSATPPGSAIRALVFDTYRSFKMFGETYDIRLCIGITEDELRFTFQEGTGPLLAALKQAGVYPFTDLDRRSVVAQT